MRRTVRTVGVNDGLKPSDASRPESCLKSGGGRVDQPVAGARLGEQVARARRIGLDLAPQVGDVDVEVVRLDLVARAPTPRAAASGA